jgi:hypothetical protein
MFTRTKYEMLCTMEMYWAVASMKLDAMRRASSCDEAQSA